MAWSLVGAAHLSSQDSETQVSVRLLADCDAAFELPANRFDGAACPLGALPTACEPLAVHADIISTRFDQE